MVGDRWEQTVLFMENLQANGKAYMGNEYWGCNSSTQPGLPLRMNASSVQYIVGSYLLGKGRAAAVRIGPTLCPGGCTTAAQVRKMPGWPRSWANSSPFSLYSHRMHGQIAPFGPT